MISDVERLREALIRSGLDASRVGEAAQIAHALGIRSSDPLYHLVIVLHALAVSDRARGAETAKKTAMAAAHRAADEAASRVVRDVGLRCLVVAAVVSAVLSLGAWWVGWTAGRNTVSQQAHVVWQEQR